MSSMNFINLKDGKRIKCKPLSETEFDDLKNAKSSEFLKDYLFGYDCFVYVLENGSVIVKDEVAQTLFNSFNDFELVLNDYYSDTEIMYSINVYGKDFLAKKEELIIDLLSDLSLSKSVDLDFPFLAQVDKAILSLKGDKKKAYYADTFMNILAITGAVLVNDFGLQWKMKLSQADNKTWNPYLSYGRKEIPFFSYYYEDLYMNEFDESLCCKLYDSVAAIIKYHRTGNVNDTWPNWIG